MPPMKLFLSDSSSRPRAQNALVFDAQENCAGAGCRKKHYDVGRTRAEAQQKQFRTEGTSRYSEVPACDIVLPKMIALVTRGVALR